MQTTVRLLASALCLTLSACAHASPRLRAARVLVASGATAVVLGGLAAAGCADDGCSAGPDDTDLRVGIPVVAAGAALIVGGLLLKPREPARLFRLPSSSAPPGPVVPRLP